VALEWLLANQETAMTPPEALQSFPRPVPQVGRVWVEPVRGM